MHTPTMQAVIDRRLLINYRVDVDVARKLVPEPFHIQEVNGYAVAGICLIRLKHVRPKGVPARLGVSSQNAAHRIAVTWRQDGVVTSGVYIPERHTNSALSVLAGGRLFPGVHRRARFSIDESDSGLSVKLKASIGETRVIAQVGVGSPFAQSALFESIDDASAFFRNGPTGYSPAMTSGVCEGITLTSEAWNIQPAELRRVTSSFFDDTAKFPAGSIEIDSAFVMRNLAVSWTAQGRISLVSTQTGLIVHR